MRTGGRVAKQQDELGFHVGRDRVLPAVSFAVHLFPFEADHVDEQAFGEAVAPHDRDRHLATLRREAQRAVVEELGVTVFDEPVHRLGDGRCRQPEALDQTGADGHGSFFLDFEDRFEVLLGCVVELGHR